MRSGKPKAIAANLHKIACVHQGPEPPLEPGALIRAYLQEAHKFFGGRRMIDEVAESS
jgi:hypothetical protein